MDNRLKVALAAVLFLGIGGVAALMLTGNLLGPSAADRERARTLFTQAQASIASGDQDAALSALNTSIQLDPQNDALRARAGIYIARNDFDGATRDLDKVIGRGGGLAENYSTRCWLRARGDNLQGARADCDRAIEIDAAQASAFGNRGLVSLKQRRYREAWRDFNTALAVGGSDQWVGWRLFGRGVAAWSEGRTVEGRQDIEQALHSNPTVVAEFAPFGVGGDVVAEFDNSTYAAANDPRSLISLQQYLYVYPNGAHVAEARQQLAEIYAWIAEDQAAGRATIPGFSFAQGRGNGPQDDSFGAIAISRSTWRVAFVTDYATPNEAVRAGAQVCNSGAVRDCDAYAFRNVCAALAISPQERTRGMAWAHGQDDAVRTAILDCRDRGGRHCVVVHSQCTPTPPAEAPTPAASP